MSNLSTEEVALVSLCVTSAFKVVERFLDKRPAALKALAKKWQDANEACEERYEQLRKEMLELVEGLKGQINGKPEAESAE